jgi:hypothetical protein
MTWPKIKTFLLKSTDILGCLMLLLFAVWYIFINEYIWAAATFALFIFIAYWCIKDYTNPSRSGRYIGVLIVMIFNVHKEYKIYMQTARMEKFGIVFNETRRHLNIPLIPVEWHTKYPFDRSITWMGQEGAIGHERKDIDADTLGRIWLENDRYNLNPVKGLEREISITTDYAKRNTKDFIDYSYDAGNKDTTISRQQADSIFKAEKIKSDF